jgi:uncharacterized protein (DUF952 family)
MIDLSISWMIFSASIALVMLVALLWWWYPRLRKNSFQLDPPIVKKAVMSVEQQYAEDIAAGRAVLVVPITGRNDWSSYLRWLRLTGLLLCLYIIIFLPRCQLYFGMSGELLGIVGGLLFFSVNPTFDWIESQRRWSSAKADGYFPSRQTIQKKPFIAYKITDAIQLKQKKPIFFRGVAILFLIGLMTAVMINKSKFYPHDWHAINTQLQQECLSKQVHHSH